MSTKGRAGGAARGEGGLPRYRDRDFDTGRHDPYQASGKYPDPTVCGDCGAVYRAGRWTWATVPDGAARVHCPACRRIAAQDPAGELVLGGAFLREHGDDVLSVVRATAEREAKEHAMNRIIGIRRDDDTVRVTTTDVHLPQRMAEALKSAYRGEVTLRYADAEYRVRAHWTR